MSPTRGPCAVLQLNLWISANSVGNINTAKSLHKKNRKQFASRRKRFPTLDPSCYLDYISIFIEPPLIICILCTQWPKEAILLFIIETKVVFDIIFPLFFAIIRCFLHLKIMKEEYNKIPHMFFFQIKKN